MHHKRAIIAARETFGDPTRMSPDEQHDAVLRAMYATLELSTLAGFRQDATALAAAEAAVAYAANQSRARRSEVAAALRQCADELERLVGDEPLN